MPLEAPSTALSIPPPPVVEAAVAKTAAFGELFGIPYLGVALPLLIVPLAYFGGPAFVDFINKRYDELQSGESSAAPDFAPRAPGNQAANKMWSQRQADDEIARASSWGEVEPVAQKNAMEIFMTGLENLQKEPMGWYFGPPSPLYSNALPPPVIRDEGMPMAQAMPVAPPTAAPIATDAGWIGEPAAAPVATAMPTAPDGGLAPPPETGRVVPSGSKSMTKRQRRAKRGSKAAATPRVPPSTPEEISAARAGEYDYGQSE